MLTKAEMEIEASMIFKYPRIAITGLPGSGKTTLAKLLLVDYEKGHNSYTMNKEYAFVQGDEILPGNIVKVCKVIDNYIAEHFCIADLLAKVLAAEILTTETAAIRTNFAAESASQI